ncbi:MAG: trypsin-like serine protease [Deltaproteobacteria bacterium]|nr:trypsin-like serine protease [Deltaproteobacteria bacterium]
MQQLTAMLGLLALATACGRGQEPDPSPFADTGPAPAAGDRSGDDRDKILGGTSGPTLFAISSGQQQAIGALRQRGETFCSATLIAPQVVLSAAHCAYGTSDSIDFAIGRNANNPTAAIPVARIAAHPDYDQLSSLITARRDVAVFILERPAANVVSTIVPIPLNRTSIADLRGRQVQNAGYGVTRSNGSSSGRRYWSVETVAEVSSYDFTTYFEQNNAGTCNGDSGGPSLLEVDGELRVVGTVSWGDAECRGDSHFTLASHNAAWVARQIADSEGDGSGDSSSGDGACNGLDYLGACQGDVAVWCEDGELLERDCADDGQICGDTGGSYGYYCMDEEVDGDSCQGYTYAGTCEGSVLVWCEDQQVLWYDCADDGMGCGWVRSEDGYNCR